MNIYSNFAWRFDFIDFLGHSVIKGYKDWAKIHQKQFDKMDSLDTYVAKRAKRTNELMTPPAHNKTEKKTDDNVKVCN